MAGAGWGAYAVLALVAALVAIGCADGSGRVPGITDPSSTVDAGRQRPVVEVLPFNTALPFLDPDAQPTTGLGQLRAQHLPVWTSDFDWAFPPEVCGTAWELDAIAEPTSAANIAVLGDFATAAALAVMRYEHQLTRALADPTPLAQLCVATASVDPARTESLDLLASYIRNSTRSPEPAAYPDEVVVVGASETSVVAVACTARTSAEAIGEPAEAAEPDPSQARLQAYLLSVSQGMEDAVADVSFRVSDATHRTAEDCTGLDDWVTEWAGHVQDWIAEGQIWESVGLTFTADGICDSPPPDGPDECPKDWPL